MHIRRISVASIRIRIRSNKEITIRILSVRIADIRKISIRGYISAHLCLPFTPIGPRAVDFAIGLI